MQSLSIRFDNSYVRLPGHFYRRKAPTPVQAPALVRINRPLCALLGIDPDALGGPQGVEMLAGNRVPEGADPVAMAYAGHQFGNFNPQLGDGRAILLGEVVGTDGERYDLQLKGSGVTPFSRSGDGRSPLGPVLREYIVSEAMAALGLPTTRSLGAVTTGEPVLRGRALPGGVLLRVARSHIRIGTFEYFAARRDREAVAALLEHVIARHYPGTAEAPHPVLAVLEAVARRQAELIAGWQLVGFVHGVMNTDNMLVSGETIDYGPCAFMDAYDPDTVYSSIDHDGRYAYGNQPLIAQWNVGCLARALLPLIAAGGDDAVAQAQATLDAVPRWHAERLAAGYARKLGLSTREPEDAALVAQLLVSMQDDAADYTLTFRYLAALTDEHPDAVSPALREAFQPGSGLQAILPRLRERWQRDPRTGGERARAMRGASPARIPRNHLVEAAIADAEDHADFGRFHALVDALAKPFEDAEFDLMRAPRPEERVAQTFCGT